MTRYSEAATVVLKRCGPHRVHAQRSSKGGGALPRSVNPALHQPRYAAGEDDGARRRAGAALPECDTDRRRAARALGILQVLVRSMNTRNDFSVNYLISRYELQVPELRTLAIQRNRAVVEDPQATAECSCGS